MLLGRRLVNHIMKLLMKKVTNYFFLAFQFFIKYFLKLIIDVWLTGAYVNKPFYTTFYEKNEKVSNFFLQLFKIFIKNFLKLIIYICLTGSFFEIEIWY